MRTTSHSSVRSWENPESCELRGYHGPFTRSEEYDTVPGWKGVGDCTVCGSTRSVPAEEARRRVALRTAEPQH